MEDAALFCYFVSSCHTTRSQIQFLKELAIAKTAKYI